MKQVYEEPWQETERLSAMALQSKKFYVLNYNHGMSKAPIHRGYGRDVLITPDLDFFSDGVHAFGEIKCKAVATYYRIGESWDHGIDRVSYDHYRGIEDASNMTVWLFIRQLDNGMMHYANIRGWLAAYPRFAPQARYGKGGMVYWPIGCFRIVPWLAFVAGDWDDSIIRKERRL